MILGWAQILIERCSKSFKSNVSLLQSKYLQNQELRISRCKIGTKNVSFKLQNWSFIIFIYLHTQVAKLVQKEPKTTFQIKTQVAELTFIFIFYFYFFS